MTEERREIFEKMAHIGRGFEMRLAEEIPIVYMYTKDGEILTLDKQPILQYNLYRSVVSDLSHVPQRMSKFQFLDRQREIVQSEVIRKIKDAQKSDKTFILTTRPRIEAATLHYSLYLKGIWVPYTNLSHRQSPEEFEDPFPTTGFEA